MGSWKLYIFFWINVTSFDPVFLGFFWGFFFKSFPYCLLYFNKEMKVSWWKSHITILKNKSITVCIKPILMVYNICKVFFSIRLLFIWWAGQFICLLLLSDNIRIRICPTIINIFAKVAPEASACKKFTLLWLG